MQESIFISLHSNAFEVQSVFIILAAVLYLVSYHTVLMFHWLGIRLQYPHCLHTQDTTVLYQAIGKAWCKTGVSPLLKHWRYHSLAPSHINGLVQDCSISIANTQKDTTVLRWVIDVCFVFSIQHQWLLCSFLLRSQWVIDESVIDESLFDGGEHDEWEISISWHGICLYRNFNTWRLEQNTCNFASAFAWKKMSYQETYKY